MAETIYLISDLLHRNKSQGTQLDLLQNFEITRVKEQSGLVSFLSSHCICINVMF